jgi:membrane-bound lytic murein transglycosylase D
MNVLYRKGIYILYLALLILIFSCSGIEKTQVTSKTEEKTDDISEILIKTPEESFSLDGAEINNDTVTIKSEINGRLESARQHYLLAQEALENDDSTSAIKEFENAIKFLDELSFFPDIDRNDQYAELSNSIKNDYEEVIASVEELSIDAPISILREKIDDEVEQTEIKTEKIPIPKELPHTTVELEINEKVEKYVSFFMNRGEKFLPKWFYRSGYYFPMMKKIFAEEGVPQELIYLSLIESGLNPIARSWANAVGLWQFIKGTGELYDLHGNIWTDDRRNPEKATRAAARHMKDLYDIYQDWHLVLAAYNCGGGKVNKAMRRANSNDYWVISKYLPKETRGYVPQYIAISLIFMNPAQYGYQNFEIAKPFEFDTVPINDCIDLSVLAGCAKTDEEQLTLMNPELVQGCTPPNMNYTLRVPKNSSSSFLANLENIPPEKKRLYFYHIVKKGETAVSIAKKYHITKDLLTSLNNLDLLKKKKRKKSQLPAGIALKIPIKNGPKTDFASKASVKTKDNDDEQLNTKKSKKSSDIEKTKLIYVVEENDNLKKIASLYDVRISDLRNWNDIAFGEEVEESDSLEIWIANKKLSRYKNISELKANEKQKLLSTKFNPATETSKKWVSYKVKKGESLSTIAQNYDVDIKSLKKWNKLKKGYVSGGQKLKIFANVPEQENIAENSQDTKSKDVSYVVKEGETLFSIAKNNNIPLTDLKKWNDIDENSSIKTGQSLRLIPKLDKKSDIAIAKNSKKSKNIDLQNYKVKKGDNLFSIAKAYNVSVEDIKKLNNLSSEAIKNGQTLKISQSMIASSSKGDNQKPKTSGKKESYKIKKGDTLYGIAKKFNVTVNDIQQWNTLEKGLVAGKSIIIYR